MKKLFLPILTMGAVLSCTPEYSLAPPLEPPFSMHNASGPTHSSLGCAFRPCIEVIAQTKAALQPLANQLCDTVWADVTCCQDFMVTYALVFAVPNNGCAHVESE